PNFQRIDVTLSRYRGDTTLAPDPSFSGNGISVVPTALTTSRTPIELALQQDDKGMSVVVGGANRPDRAQPPITTIEQLLVNPDGGLSDDQVDVPLPGRTFVQVEGLIATATGYVATAHVQGGTAPDGMVAIPLAQEFSEPAPLDIAPANAALPLSSASSLLPDGK